MALVNAFSSLSIAAPAKAAGLGFKKAVAAFVPAPAARVSASRAVFTVEAKQNKKARTIQVRATHPPRPETGGVDLSASRIGGACRTSPSSVYLRVRVFSSRASPLRRVVGRRRDTSRRKTETLKPFSLAARVTIFSPLGC